MRCGRGPMCSSRGSISRPCLIATTRRSFRSCAASSPTLSMPVISCKRFFATRGGPPCGQRLRSSLPVRTLTVVAGSSTWPIAALSPHVGATASCTGNRSTPFPPSHQDRQACRTRLSRKLLNKMPCFVRYRVSLLMMPPAFCSTCSKDVLPPRSPQSSAARQMPRRSACLVRNSAFGQHTSKTPTLSSARS